MSRGSRSPASSLPSLRLVPVSTRQGSISSDNWESGTIILLLQLRLFQTQLSPDVPRFGHMSSRLRRHGTRHGCGSWLALAWLPSSSDSPGRAWAVVEEPDVTIVCHWGATWLNAPLRFICLLQRVIQIKATQLEAPNYQAAEIKKKKKTCCAFYKQRGNVWGSISLSKTRMLPCSLVSVLSWPQGFWLGLVAWNMRADWGAESNGSHTHTLNPTSCSLGNGWREFGGYWVKCISLEAELMTCGANSSQFEHIVAVTYYLMFLWPEVYLPKSSEHQ